MHMRLWNTSESPVGGWRYTYVDEFGNEYQVRGTSKKTLEAEVRHDMKANGIIPPSGLDSYIEDQICSHQPAGRCLYEDKAGDQLSKFIHIFAGGIDSAAGAIGINTNLERKARGCRGCSQRRTNMNQ